MVGVITDTDAKQEPLTIYVQSDRTVWAWHRAERSWIPQRFSGPLVDVQLIRGGILAIAESGAALWDTVFATWLPALDSSPEALTAGDAS